MVSALIRARLVGKGVDAREEFALLGGEFLAARLEGGPDRLHQLAVRAGEREGFFGRLSLARQEFAQGYVALMRLHLARLRHRVDGLLFRLAISLFDTPALLLLGGGLLTGAALAGGFSENLLQVFLLSFQTFAKRDLATQGERRADFGRDASLQQALLDQLGKPGRLDLGAQRLGDEFRLLCRRRRFFLRFAACIKLVAKRLHILGSGR